MSLLAHDGASDLSEELRRTAPRFGRWLSAAQRWMYEEKVRLWHWLRCHDIPHPTECFSHVLLAQVPPDEGRGEMLRSKADLTEHLRIDRPHFCFPGGSTNRALCALACDVGLRSAFPPDPRGRFNRYLDVDVYSMVRVGRPTAPADHVEVELDGPLHALPALAGRYRRRKDA